MLHHLGWHLFGLPCVHSASSSKPHVAYCYLQRWELGLSPAMSYSALVTKTNRIARILAGSKKKICTKKPRFMSACAQLVIAFILILIQLGIIVALFIMGISASDLRLSVYTRGAPHLQHPPRSEWWPPLGYNGLLISAAPSMPLRPATSLPISTRPNTSRSPCTPPALSGWLSCQFISGQTTR